MEEKAEGWKITYKTIDMHEAGRKWEEVVDSGKASYFGLNNGVYVIEARE